MKAFFRDYLIDPYIFDLLHKASILEDYNPMNYGKWMKLTALHE